MVDFKKLILSSAVCVLLLGLFGGAVYAAPESQQSATITGSVVNLRETADTSAKVLAKLPKGTLVSVIKVTSDWYKVSFSNKEGWVSSEYVTLKATTLGTGVVNTEVLNLRTKPDTSSSIVLKLQKNEKLTVIDKSPEWYKVKTSDGEAGWVSSEFVTIRRATASRGEEASREDEDAIDDTTPSESETTDSDIAQQIITYAKRFLGGEYVYGGDTPKEGFDCSGFTKYVFAKVGIELERTSADQGRQGTKVLKGNLKPGDLVFFDTNGGHNRINHVGIYIGNGKFIHASSPKTGIVITSMSDEYYSKTYMRSRRIIS